MESSTAYMITNILIDAYGGKSASGTKTAGKTGTTNLDKDTKTKHGLPSGALLDAWLVSYSPSYSIALWYGYDKIEPNAKENKYYLTSDSGGKGRRNIMNGLATNIHKKNQSFKKPNSVISVDVEKETFPPQLCSKYTPKDMCITELFVKGTEPTEVSKRYDILNNPTNGNATINGNNIALSWNEIETPEAIDLTKLSEHYNKYFGKHAEKYYNNRLADNNKFYGTLGYQVYLKDDLGNEKYIGYTNSPTFTYNTTGSGNYTFIIKSAYSIFKDNMSTGLTITAQANIEIPDDNVVDNNTENTNNNVDIDNPENLN